MALAFLDGNDSVVLGALKAGCNFFAGYPITPATSILAKMLDFLPGQGGVCLQGEDEIASIGYCLGASMAGKKCMTATSGPGISLYSEQISFAIGSEIPLVIVNVQRLAPSTGSATKGADGDIQFMRWGNSGGLPVIVLAPADVADCFILTVQAFNLAEKYRCPVFIASNKEIGLTRESVDIDSLEIPEIAERLSYTGDKASFKPFSAETAQSPPFMPIGGEALVRQTSSTHGDDGYITTDSDEMSKQRQRLKEKLELHVKSFSYAEMVTNQGAETLLITYGVTSRAAREVVGTIGSCSLLILKTLWPVPEKLIKDHAEKYSDILVIEMNLGQYVYEIQRVLGEGSVRFLGQMNGALITPAQIIEEVHNG